MALQLFNTMGMELQDFIPLKDKSVGFYGCGPTVYNYAHIGNLRAFVFQDVLKRSLTFLGYDVRHVMNITDVGHLTDDGDDGEDKMLRTAKERGKSVLEVADFYTQAFFKDCEALNIIRPSVICKATEHIDDMIALIQRLEERGHTYFAGGNLYYDISTFPDYGKLAKIKVDDLKAGARIEVDQNKRNPFDFVLWFTKSKFENHALNWDSPWGRGYPGWHVECSAMSMKYLGERFDIHTGGIDHIRIHHTNEIAQSEGATGSSWVKYWLHNEFLIMEKSKMSKSSGNFLTLQSLIDDGYASLDYRFLLLSGHYRSQLNFSWTAMDTAKSARKNLQKRVNNLIEALSTEEQSALQEITKESFNYDSAFVQLKNTDAQKALSDFKSALEVDIATPKALSVLQTAVKNKAVPAYETLVVVHACDSVFGLDLLAALNAEKATPSVDSARIEALIEERLQARKNKDFARADEIRDSLKAEGIILEDSAQGTTWKQA